MPTSIPTPMLTPMSSPIPTPAPSPTPIPSLISIMGGKNLDVFYFLLAILGIAILALLVGMGIVLAKKVKDNDHATRTCIAFGVLIIILVVLLYLLMSNEMATVNTALAGLISTFSTIIGFYFGSKKAGDKENPDPKLKTKTKPNDDTD